MATTISNVARINNKFEKLIKKAKENLHPVVIVGYTANYALHVHENIEMKWYGISRNDEDVHTKIVFSKKLGRNVRKELTSKQMTARAKARGVYWEGTGGMGQAKFLEQPARNLKAEFQHLIHTAVKNGATLMQALYIAGLRLKRESQLLVPVDTGNLKASAFVIKLPVGIGIPIAE